MNEGFASNEDSDAILGEPVGSALAKITFSAIQADEPVRSGGDGLDRDPILEVGSGHGRHLYGLGCPYHTEREKWTEWEPPKNRAFPFFITQSVTYKRRERVVAGRMSG
jgi:hypothetical protein